MKFAYPVVTPEVKQKGLAYGGQLSEVLPLIRSIGYEGVELVMRDPKAMDLQELQKIIEKCDFEVPVISTGPLKNEDKLAFTDPDKDVRLKAIKRIKEIIDVAKTYSAFVSIGNLRGNVRLTGELQLREWQGQAIDTVCDYAEKKNITIILEPQNRYVVDNLNSTEETINFIKSKNIANLMMMLDVFHMNIEDSSIMRSIIKASKYNRYIHFSDNHRGVPGSGHINFVEIIRLLKEIDYNHYIAMEIKQIPDSYQAAEKAFVYLNHLIDM